jgi:hypothetical protein
VRAVAVAADRDRRALRELGQRLDFAEESMIDPWAKASECERAAHATTDPERWAVLTELRDQWISFANEKSFMTDADRAKEIAAIDALHAAALASATPSA